MAKRTLIGLSRNTKAFIDPKFADLSQLKTLNVAAAVGNPNFTVGTKLHIDLRWGNTAEELAAHAQELGLCRYSQKSVGSIYFKLKPGVDTSNLNQHLRNFLMHLTCLRGFNGDRKLLQALGSLLAGPSNSFKLDENEGRFVWSFAIDWGLIVGQSSRGDYNTLKSWAKDSYYLPTVD
jgi:hypothetical protein